VVSLVLPIRVGFWWIYLLTNHGVPFFFFMLLFIVDQLVLQLVESALSDTLPSFKNSVWSLNDCSPRGNCFHWCQIGDRCYWAGIITHICNCSLVVSTCVCYIVLRSGTLDMRVMICWTVCVVESSALHRIWDVGGRGTMHISKESVEYLLLSSLPGVPIIVPSFILLSWKTFSLDS